MKRIYNYTFQLVCIYIMILSFFTISSFELVIDHYDVKVNNENQYKVADSVLLAQNEKQTNEEESIRIVEETIESTPKNKTENVDMTDTSSAKVLATETVNISHYGHDCYGCKTGHTASGYYVGDGRVYYNDKDFGNVRIVAADKKYPLGTILRIGYHNSVITAIVLDRGGAIGDGKKYQIDLLTYNEKASYELGIVNNTSLEVLRLGY